MRGYRWRVTLGMLGWAVLVTGCQTTGVNPTGLYGREVRCSEGSRQTLDCRGAIQQYARDLKADVSSAEPVTLGVGLVSTKLIEADAITSDLVAHYYQTCSLYNACLISRDEYVERTGRLQDIQLSVRQALVALGVGAQQNIQINPPGAVRQRPGAPGGGAPEIPVPRRSLPVPEGQRPPVAATGAGDGDSAQSSPSPSGPPPDRVDAILGILREGSKLLKQPPARATGPAAATPAPPAAPLEPGAPSAQSSPPVRTGSGIVGPIPSARESAASPPDLDSSLRAVLVSLQREIVRRDPSFAAARAAVGNFTEEDRPWSGPLGAMLQDQVSRLVQTGTVFAPAPGSLVRGITVRQVSGVANPNEAPALSAMLGGDLVIVGSYRLQDDQVAFRLLAVDGRGRELGRAGGAIARTAIPGQWAESPANATSTGQLLNVLDQLGPRTQGAVRVELATNRPGAGASFRVGEDVRYFVKSSVEGHLYLFHVDAERNVARIFPNSHQRDARIRGGEPVEVPGPGAKFKFEIGPPFGLETTLAIVTRVALEERDLQAIEVAFSKPKPSVPEVLASRGLQVVPVDSGSGGGGGAADGGAWSSSQLVWSSVTVLIRP